MEMKKRYGEDLSSLLIREERPNDADHAKAGDARI